jgi:malate permease and related proteins
MSTVGLHVAETVIAFTLLVLAGYFLKRKGVLKQEDSPIFARLLTQAILPATIFYQLWTYHLSGENFVPVLIMFLSGIAALVISWLAGVLFKFDRPSTGALMIISSFGSSALIGYPIIQYTFSNDPQALAEGIAISELGVGLPIFILCPLVAMYFGGTFKGGQDLGKLARDYLLSPIFISVVLGFAFSRVNIPDGMPLVDTIREALKMTQGALVVISAIILGLQLSFQPAKGFWALIAVSIVVQMFFQPWFSNAASGLLRITAENRQILVLISAMPAAILGPVFAARYDCAAKTASLLTFTHIAISPVLVPAVFAFLS